MKIAVVHSFYSTRTPSGENVAVESQVQLLRQSGHEVKVIARMTDAEESGRLYRIRAAAAAANITGPDPTPQLEDFKPDVVHVHNLFPNWGTAWLDKWSRRLVATLHNYRTICSSGTMWRNGHDCDECIRRTTTAAVKNKCYRNSAIATLPLAFASRSHGKHQPLLHSPSKLIVLNETAHARFARTTQVPIVTIPNFVPSSMSVQAEEYWLYVGRLSPEKGVIELAESFPHGEQLVIVGDGPLMDSVRDIQDRRPDSIHVIGALSHEETLRKIASAKGVIIPSLCSEGLPTVALEALAAGVPIILSDHISAARELTYGGAGTIFDPEQVSMLQNSISTISADRQRFSSAARELHMSNYSPQSWLEAMLGVYEDFADALGPGRRR